MVFGPILAALAGSAMSSMFGGGGQQAPNSQANTNTPMIPAGSVGQSQGFEGPIKMLFKSLGNRGGDMMMDNMFAGQQGKNAGRKAKAYYDQAFPGTNPWERLGAGNPSGQLAQVDNQKSMQMRELQTRERIADKQIAGAQNVAAISARAPGRQAGVAERTAPSNIMRNVKSALLAAAQAKYQSSRAVLEGERAKLAKSVAQAELNGLITKNMASMILAAVDDPSKAIAMAGRLGVGKFASGAALGMSLKKAMSTAAGKFKPRFRGDLPGKGVGAKGSRVRRPFGKSRPGVPKAMPKGKKVPHYRTEFGKQYDGWIKSK